MYACLFGHCVPELVVDQKVVCIPFGRDMTDAEYDALDEELTRTTPKLTAVPGVFAAQRIPAMPGDNALNDC
jgi:hypothetical protein